MTEQKLYIDERDRRYFICPKCKDKVLARESWLDNDGFDKHYGCLSDQRKKEVNGGTSEA